MARIPKPWFRDQTQSWYVKIGGVQHPLGKDKKEADKAYHRLMAGEGLAQPIKDLALGGLVEQFLADSAKSCTLDTVQWYRVFLEDFAERYPKLKPTDIAPRHVRAWLNADRRRLWKQSTHRSAITILKRLLNWSVENRLLKENPIQDMEGPGGHGASPHPDRCRAREDPVVVPRRRSVPRPADRVHRGGNPAR